MKYTLTLLLLTAALHAQAGTPQPFVQPPSAEQYLQRIAVLDDQISGFVIKVPDSLIAFIGEVRFARKLTATEKSKVTSSFNAQLTKLKAKRVVLIDSLALVLPKK